MYDILFFLLFLVNKNDILKEMMTFFLKKNKMS